MTAEKVKRKRSVNFSEDEKLRFLRIIQKKGQVIISKVASHDLESNRLKEDAWTEVTNAVNESRTDGSVIRNKYNLKKLWQKMKTKVKSFSQTNGTGEGTPKKMDDSILQFVADLTGYGSSAVGSPASEVESTDDSDSHVMCIKQEKIQEKINLKRRWPTVSDHEESIPDTPQSLKNSDHNSLTSQKLKCEVVKLELFQLKKQQMIEEHILKVREGNLKTKILEIILKKIEDDKPVDLELMKLAYM